MAFKKIRRLITSTTKFCTGGSRSIFMPPPVAQCERPVKIVSITGVYLRCVSVNTFTHGECIKLCSSPSRRKAQLKKLHKFHQNEQERCFGVWNMWDRICCGQVTRDPKHTKIQPSDQLKNTAARKSLKNYHGSHRKRKKWRRERMNSNFSKNFDELTLNWSTHQISLLPNILAPTANGKLT